MMSTHTETRRVNNQFDFKGHSYWVVADVDVLVDEVPAEYNSYTGWSPPEINVEIVNVDVEELTVMVGDNELDIKIHDIPFDLMSKIEEFCGEEI